jgi:8-oxo-dGTP diphosphatase
MECFACELEENQQIALLEHKNAKWLDKSNLYSVEWLPADVDVLDKIEEML